MTGLRFPVILAVVLGLGLATAAWAQPSTTTDIGTLDKAAADRAFPKAPYSPYAGRSFPTRPFFGDTHLHTSYSMDAGAFGARIGPRDAYRFAKGEEITASSGQRVKLSRSLDFLVVADHSDNMGFFPQLLAGNPALLADPTGRRWYDMMQAVKGGEAAFEIIVAFSQGKFPKALQRRPEAGTGKLPSVGNTVDVANATYTNTIGDPELITVWKDPDFDPSLRAFYYARVLEIPTPRWTAYDAKYFGVKLPPEVPMTLQERAYTSPIWYTP